MTVAEIKEKIEELKEDIFERVQHDPAAWEEAVAVAIEEFGEEAVAEVAEIK